MASIHIIDSIRLSHKGLCVLDENSKWVKLHKQQGDLDGACAIYSLVMAMLCKGLLTDDETQVYNRPDRRTDKGKFLYQFFNERGMIREGYSYVTLAKEINESSFGIKATRKNPRTNNGRVELISDYIYDNIPVIISVVFENKTAALSPILLISRATQDNLTGYKYTPIILTGGIVFDRPENVKDALEDVVNKNYAAVDRGGEIVKVIEESFTHKPFSSFMFSSPFVIQFHIYVILGSLIILE